MGDERMNHELEDELKNRTSKVQIPSDRIIEGTNGYKYLDQLLAIQRCAFEHGFDITLKEAKNIWEDYSEFMFGGFVSFDTNDMDGMWRCISASFPETDENDVKDFIKDNM